MKGKYPVSVPSQTHAWSLIPEGVQSAVRSEMHEAFEGPAETLGTAGSVMVMLAHAGLDGDGPKAEGPSNPAWIHPILSH